MFYQTLREESGEGELPTWDDVLTYLKSLRPGRYRFLRTISVGFGLRMSEAFAVEEEDFFGAESQDDIESRNDFISRLVEKELGILFLYVNKADKKSVPKDFIKILGDQDNEPKSSPYTACCTNVEIAAFIVEMLENGEHRESFTKNELYRTI